MKGRSYVGLVATASVSFFIMAVVVTRQWSLSRLYRVPPNSERPQVSSSPLSPPNANYTCETNTTAAFDSSSSPCFNSSQLHRQSIYAITSPVSYLYCSIPKNGCTYHLGVMQRLLGEPYEGGPTVHLRENKNRLVIPPSQLVEMLQDTRVEKYMVVRNPLERALSAYFDKVERHLPAANRTPASFERWAYKELEMGMEKKLSSNPHWRPQVAFCGFSMRDLWTRFRWFTVEDPVEYVDYLETMLPEWVTRDGWNGSENSSLRQSVLGPRKRTGNTSDRFYKYVSTVELFDHLAAVYKADIETLGYQKDVADMRKRVLSRIDISESERTSADV